MHQAPSKSTANLAHELVTHINNRLEILFNTVQTQLTNGITKRGLLHDIDGISIEINRYLNSYAQPRFNKLCKYHLKGKCWFGERCWYRHETRVLSRPSTPQPKKTPKTCSPPRTMTPPSRWAPVVCQTTNTSSTKTLPYWRGRQLAGYSKKACKKTSAAKQRSTALVFKQQPSQLKPSPKTTVPKTKQPTTVVTSKKSSENEAKPQVPRIVTPSRPTAAYREIYEDLVCNVAERKQAFSWSETKTTLLGIRRSQDVSEMRKLYIDYCHVMGHSWIAKEETINDLLGIGTRKETIEQTKPLSPHITKHEKLQAQKSAKISPKKPVGYQKLNQTIPPSLRGLRYSDLVSL